MARRGDRNLRNSLLQVCRLIAQSDSDLHSAIKVDEPSARREEALATHNVAGLNVADEPLRVLGVDPVSLGKVRRVALEHRGPRGHVRDKERQHDLREQQAGL